MNFLISFFLLHFWKQILTFFLTLNILSELKQFSGELANLDNPILPNQNKAVWDNWVDISYLSFLHLPLTGNHKETHGSINIWVSVTINFPDWMEQNKVVLSSLLFLNYSVGGLARYCVHMTATGDQFCNVIIQVRNHSDGMFLVFPWLIESRSYKKNQVWNITHHASHITHPILHRNF